MEDPNDKKFRIRQLVIFSILMAGVLASIIALYSISRPFITDAGYLNLVLIVAIVIFTIAYIMAVKSGIPPSPPKTREVFNPEVKPPSPPESIINPAKHGNLSSSPQAAVSSGIPPATRKPNP